MVVKKDVTNEHKNFAFSNKIANAWRWVSHAPFIAMILVQPAFAAETEVSAQVNIKKGEALAKQMCVSCHTDDGSHGVALIPIIQGQRAHYIVKQLNDFKSGTRVNAVMQSLVGSLREEDMTNIAEYFSNLSRVEVRTPKNVTLVEAGKKIYSTGISGKSVPACAACHEPGSPGMTADSPILYGQRQDYLKLQLTNFRLGARKNSELMSQMSQYLTDDEINSISAHLESTASEKRK